MFVIITTEQCYVYYRHKYKRGPLNTNYMKYKDYN